VAGGGGADSMLQFQFESGGDRTKRCWKIKCKQRARVGSMGRKRDTMRWRGDIGRKRGGTEEGKGRTQRQLGCRESYWDEKMKKIHAFDSGATNRW
jgi:hypothetical protein